MKEMKEYKEHYDEGGRVWPLWHEEAGTSIMTQQTIQCNGQDEGAQRTMRWRRSVSVVARWSGHEQGKRHDEGHTSLWSLKVVKVKGGDTNLSKKIYLY